MDVHNKQQRSFNMSRIKNRDTKPEISFRKYIWEKGVRGYRLHVKLKGKPDLYFPGRKVAVFIDGCFWHQCPECFRKPATNKKFWSKKIKENIKRDLATDIELCKNGVRVLRLWEHEIEKFPQESYRKLKQLINIC